MPKYLLDSAAYIDLQGARKHVREPWAASTISHAAKIAEKQSLGLSSLSIMEIVKGFELDSMEAEIQALPFTHPANVRNLQP